MQQLVSLQNLPVLLLQEIATSTMTMMVMKDDNVDNDYNDGNDNNDDSKDDNDDDDDDDETVVTLAVIKQLIQMIQIKDTRRAPKYRNLPREYDQTRKLTTKPENSEPYKTVSPAFTNIYSSGQNSLCPVQVSHLHQALLIDTQGGNIKP